MRELIDKIALFEGWQEDLAKIADRAAQRPTLKNLQKLEKEATEVEGSWYEILTDSTLIGNFYGLVAKKLGLPMMFHADGSGAASLTKRNPENKNQFLVVTDGSRQKDAQEVAKKQSDLDALHPKLKSKFKLDYASAEMKPKDRDRIDTYEPEKVPSSVKSGPVRKRPKSGSVDAPKQTRKNWTVKELKGLKADNENIGSLLHQYHRIIQKYNGLGFQKKVDMTRDSNQFIGKNILKEATAAEIDNDVKIIAGIRRAIEDGLSSGSLSKSVNSTLVKKALADYNDNIKMIKNTTPREPSERGNGIQGELKNKRQSQDPFAQQVSTGANAYKVGKDAMSAPKPDEDTVKPIPGTKPPEEGMWYVPQDDGRFAHFRNGDMGILTKKEDGPLDGYKKYDSGWMHPTVKKYFDRYQPGGGDTGEDPEIPTKPAAPTNEPPPLSITTQAPTGQAQGQGGGTGGTPKGQGGRFSPKDSTGIEVRVEWDNVAQGYKLVKFDPADNSTTDIPGYFQQDINRANKMAQQYADAVGGTAIPAEPRQQSTPAQAQPPTTPPQNKSEDDMAIANLLKNTQAAAAAMQKAPTLLQKRQLYKQWETKWQDEYDEYVDNPDTLTLDQRQTIDKLKGIWNVMKQLYNSSGNESKYPNIEGKIMTNELHNIKKLAGLSTQINEASMNISMNGNTSGEIAELMSLLTNAGVEKMPAMTMSEPESAPCPHCAAMHDMESPCGEAVEEEWDNAPEEEYQNDDYMINDLSGGLNRKKDKQALRVKDPAVATESKFKSMLKTSLEEMYQKLDEKDPFAELDRAIASDDMEGDLERQEKLARLKMKKKDRSRADAAHDELSKYMDTKEATTGNMSDEEAQAIRDKMKRLTGTGRAGKQHPQYQQLMQKRQAQGPKTAAAPQAKGVQGALAQGPKTAAAPQAKPVSTKKPIDAYSISPVTASLIRKAFPQYIEKGVPVEKIANFFVDKKGIAAKDLDSFLQFQIKQNRSK